MAASGKAIEDFNEVMNWDYISNELRNWSKEKGLYNDKDWIELMENEEESIMDYFQSGFEEEYNRILDEKYENAGDDEEEEGEEEERKIDDDY